MAYVQDFMITAQIAVVTSVLDHILSKVSFLQGFLYIFTGSHTYTVINCIGVPNNMP